VTPPLAFAAVDQPKGEGLTPGAAGIIGAAAGAAVGAGAVLMSRLGKVEVEKEGAAESGGEQG